MWIMRAVYQKHYKLGKKFRGFSKIHLHGLQYTVCNGKVLSESKIRKLQYVKDKMVVNPPQTMHSMGVWKCYRHFTTRDRKRYRCMVSYPIGLHGNANKKVQRLISFKSYLPKPMAASCKFSSGG